jgi:endoglucanase
VLDDWVTVNTQKQGLVGPYLIPPTGAGGGTTPTTPSSSATSSPPATTGSCSIAYTLTNTWQGGFQAMATVTNTATSAANNWAITWTMPSGVTLASGWNATVTQSASTVTAAAPSWSPNLAAGASVGIGFTANGPSSPAPSGFKLNGTTCTTA